MKNISESLLYLRYGTPETGMQIQRDE
ncbi:unnamed protein product, partial [Allacma fusca]